MHESQQIWVLADDRAGNVSQAVGVAQALDLPFEIKDIAYSSKAAWPNCLRGASLCGLTKDTAAAMTAPWPELVIAAGRRSFPVARYIKKKSGNKTRIVQLMDPGLWGRRDVDLLVQPVHDRHLLSGDKVVPLVGAAHKVTPDVLEKAHKDFASLLEPLKAPRVAVIVGGATKNRPFTPLMARDLAQKVQALIPDASFMITTSRRTGEESEAALFESFENPHVRFGWGDKGENPYFGYLAWADVIVVTGDSVSMCTEACAQTKPCYIYAPEGMVGPKHARFHQALYKRGMARPLSGEGMTESWEHEPLHPAADIAALIKSRLLAT